MAVLLNRQGRARLYDGVEALSTERRLTAQQGGSKAAIITACQPRHEDVIREGAGSVREHPPTVLHRYSSDILVT